MEDESTQSSDFIPELPDFGGTPQPAIKSDSAPLQDVKPETEGKAAESGEKATQDVDKPDDIDAKPDKSKAKEAFQARRSQRLVDEANQRIAALEEKIASFSAPEKPQAKPTDAPKRPDPKDFEFDSWDPRYYEALEAWQDSREAYLLDRVDKAARETTSKYQTEAQTAKEQATLLARLDDIEKRGLDRYEDFDDSIRDALTAMPPAPEALIELVRMENAEDVLYHLSQRPEALEKITALSPMGQALEFGKISARLAGSAKVAGKVSKVKPTPDTPVGAGTKHSTEANTRYDRMLKAAEKW